MPNVILQGFKSPFLITQGYAAHAVTITVNPSAATVLINAQITFTASVNANWSATGGSLSASTGTTIVWTAPGTTGKFYITVENALDPGDQVIVPIVVVASFGGAGGGIVDATGVGNLVNATRVGAYSGSAGGPVPPSPVLLPDLVAGWALTAGPQQTLSSAGVVASGPLDLTEHGSPSYGANGVSLNGLDQYLTTNSNLLNITDAILICARIIYSGPNNADAVQTVYGRDGGGYGIDAQLNGGVLGTDVDVNMQNFPDGFAATPANTVLVDTGTVCFWYFDDNAQQVGVEAGTGTVYTGAATGHLPSVTGLTTYIGGAGWASDVLVKGNIGLLYIWQGANARTIIGNAIYRSWLVNGNAGRTPTEVAAYPG